MEKRRTNPAMSMEVVQTMLTSLTPLGYQQVTSTAAAFSLTPPAGATIAEISVEAQGVRYRDDGTAPTATVGMLVASGTRFTYVGDLAAVRFIAQSAGAILNVSYYG